jgi:ubiquitin carboxyl-terminal hydrolase L3
VINGLTVDFIKPGSDLAIPLDMIKSAEILYNSEPFEMAHKSVEQVGDSYADPAIERNGGHFASFVKSDGRLW